MSTKLRPLWWLGVLLVSGTVLAVPDLWREGAARGFPTLVDPLSGQVLANGMHRQWVTGDLLHVQTSFVFRDGRRTREVQLLRQGEELAPLSWSWEESRDGVPTRVFTVNFDTREATAMKMENGRPRFWRERLDLHPGQAFAGGSFVFALKDLSRRLSRGESVELQAVAFTPKPRLVNVRVSSAGVESIQIEGRRFSANHFVIHPDLPWFLRLFVHPKDNQLWFYRAPPPALLRGVGPQMEPSDPVVETDVEPPNRPVQARRAPPLPRPR